MSFRNMDPEKRFEICSKAGKAAHAQGKAHVFSADEAKAAGALGGKSVLAKRGREYFRELGRKGGNSISKDREYMAAIGKKGGIAVSQDREHMSEIGSLGGSATNSETAPAAE